MKILSYLTAILLFIVSIISFNLTKIKLNENMMLRKEIFETQNYYKSIASVERTKKILINNNKISSLEFVDLNQTVSIEQVQRISELKEVIDLNNFTLPNNSPLIFETKILNNNIDPYYAISIFDKHSNLIYSYSDNKSISITLTDISNKNNLKANYTKTDNVDIKFYYEDIHYKYKLTITGENNYQRIVYVII